MSLLHFDCNLPADARCRLQWLMNGGLDSMQISQRRDLNQAHGSSFSTKLLPTSSVSR